MNVYLVKRQIFRNNVWTEDHLIGVCSNLDIAMGYIHLPNFDTIITRWTCDAGPDSEILIQNIDHVRPRSETRELNIIKYGTKEDI